MLPISTKTSNCNCTAVKSGSFTAHGYYRVMRLIIEENGNNSWLAHGTPHCDVRRDYLNTPTGIKLKHCLVDVNMFFNSYYHYIINLHPNMNFHLCQQLCSYYTVVLVLILTATRWSDPRQAELVRLKKENQERYER